MLLYFHSMRAQSRTEAKIAIKKAMSDIVKQSTIASAAIKKFYPDMEWTRETIVSIGTRAGSVRSIIDKFPE